MGNEKYHPEKYWSEVGSKIKSRDTGKNVIAGDDEPYYRYKREQFLKQLHTIDFSGKSVLEIGCGPGGNLLEILKHKPKRLVGVDISAQMVALAKDKLPENVEILKINGEVLPFEDNSFDIVFTATVLQHNTDDKMLRNILNEITRVCGSELFLFERIESDIIGDDLCKGRPVQYYSALVTQQGFKYKSSEFINIRVSYYICGAIRKLLNPKSRKEGEPLNAISVFLQKITLPLTKILDKIFTSNKDLAKLTFNKVIS